MFIYLFLSILCTNENIAKEHRFFIVTDREIKGLVIQDRTQSTLFAPEDSECNLRVDIIWDKYFPKPIIYEFNCEKLMKSKYPACLNLEGITSNNEVLFRFKLGVNHNVVVLYDFYDPYDVPITNAQFDVIEDSKNIFMVSRRNKNVESLRNSFKYIIYTDAIEPLCMDILKNLLRYILSIEDLAANVNIENDENILRRLSVAENAMILITISILKNLSSSRIPKIYELDELPTIEIFETMMNNIFKSLETVVKIYLNRKNKESKKQVVINQSDIINYIRNEIIRDDSLVKCVQMYGKYTSELKSIKEFVSGVFNLKNTNAEILSDCDIEKIDEFVQNYSSLLLSYCKIMKSSNDKNVFRHCFPSKTSEIDFSIKKIDDFFTDKLIANRLMHFINNYDKNKTDLMIFLQTDYFKYKLSFQIIENLNLLAKICLIYNTSKETQDKVKGNIFQINLEYYSRINNLKKTWLSILQDDKTFDLRCFKLIFSQDKLPLTITHDELQHKPVVLEEKQRNKLGKNIKTPTPVGGEPKDKSLGKSIFVISAFIIIFILLSCVCIICTIKTSR